jgi:predicted  nucleic acid-binding Zn-ribbon protein
MEQFKPLLMQLLGALIIGGMIAMGTVRVLETKLDNINNDVQRNTNSIKELANVVNKNEDQAYESLKTLSDLLVAIRLEMARRTSIDNSITGVQDNLNKIWPQLREMRERIQRLEPDNAPDWRN